MRKASPLLLAALAVILPSAGWAKMYEEPRSFSLADKSLERIDRKVLKAVDVKALIQEDARRDKVRENPGPHRFAVPADVSLDPASAGTWEDVPDGRLWRLRIHSPNARSHNLGITRYEMPPGAKLWVYDPGHKHVEGPYTARNRSHRGSLWTPVIEGDEIVVEVFVPRGAAQPALLIKVNQGFRGFEKDTLPGASPEGACEIDVVCPDSAGFEDQVRAVGVYTLNGQADCSGTMVNNTALDFKPLFLSANHCGVNAGNDDTVVVYWNFESPVCGDHGPGSLADNQTGSTFRASNAFSDFQLIELDAQPDPAFHVFYAGWDATGVAPPGIVAIHHPAADVKTISFSHTAPQSTAYYSDTPDPTANHWRIVWDTPAGNPAVTEPGSSGSCIFRSDNKRCIGQLHGGPSACGVSAANLHDFYGKLSVSWDHGTTAGTRLKDWLDPGNTGSLSLDGDPHITTVDGTRYDFQGAGEYVVLREGPDVEIQTRQSPVATSSNPPTDAHDGLATCVSLNTAVAARVGKRRVTYEPNLSGVPDPSGMQLRVDGALTTLGPAGLDLGQGGRIAPTAAAGGLEITFPEKYVLYVTPDFWTSQGKWFLNVDVSRTAATAGVGGASPGPAATGNGGLGAAIAPGSWLPALPDGSSMGSMPAALHDRYVDLYQKFGEAWRVNGQTSLFDYAPGTSTDTFTMKTWPLEHPPCIIPDAPRAKPLSLAAAQQACAGVRDRHTNANCVFDVRVTGERGFAKLYSFTQRIATGATQVVVRDEKDPTKYREAAVFQAVVTRREAGGALAARSVPKGTVQFLADGEPLEGAQPLDTRGRAIIRTEKLKPGRHTIAARYTPARGTAFLGSTSAGEPHEVIGQD